MGSQSSQDNIVTQTIKYISVSAGRNVYPGKNDRIPIGPEYRQFLQINGRYAYETHGDYMPAIYDRKHLFSKGPRNVSSHLSVYTGPMYYSTKVSVAGPVFERMDFNVRIGVAFDIREPEGASDVPTSTTLAQDQLEALRAIAMLFVMKGKEYSPEESVMRVGKTDYMLSTMTMERFTGFLDEMLKPALEYCIRDAVSQITESSYGEIDRIVSNAVGNDRRFIEDLSKIALRLSGMPLVSHEPTIVDRLRQKSLDLPPGTRFRDGHEVNTPQ